MGAGPKARRAGVARMASNVVQKMLRQQVEAMEPVLNTAPTSMGLQLLRFMTSRMFKRHPGDAEGLRASQCGAINLLQTVEASAFSVSRDVAAAMSFFSLFGDDVSSEGSSRGPLNNLFLSSASDQKRLSQSEGVGGKGVRAYPFGVHVSESLLLGSSKAVAHFSQLHPCTPTSYDCDGLQGAVTV